MVKEDNLGKGVSHLTFKNLRILNLSGREAWLPGPHESFSSLPVGPSQLLEKGSNPCQQDCVL